MVGLSMDTRACGLAYVLSKCLEIIPFATWCLIRAADRLHPMGSARPGCCRPAKVKFDNLIFLIYHKSLSLVKLYIFTS
jgi:hypothetical protein